MKKTKKIKQLVDFDQKKFSEYGDRYVYEAFGLESAIDNAIFYGHGPTGIYEDEFNNIFVMEEDNGKTIITQFESLESAMDYFEINN